MGTKHIDGNLNVNGEILRNGKPILIKSLYHLGVADSVIESNGITTITRKTGYLDISELNWTYNSEYQMFVSSEVPNVTRVSGGVISAVCSKYTRAYGGYSNIQNGQFVLADNGWSSTAYLLIKDASFNGDATAFKTANKGVRLEYETTSSYTEQVPTEQPLNTLDQQGSVFVREEWEKSQNLFDVNNSSVYSEVTKTSTGLSFTNTGVDGAPLTLGLVKNVFPNIEVGKTYVLTVVEVNVALHELYVAGSALDWFYGTSHTFTQNDLDNPVYAYGIHNLVCELANIMLVEGDHAYPYQPYNGAIVHKKELDNNLSNCARKDQNNYFETRQQIRGSDDTPLVLVGSNNSMVNIQFVKLYNNQATNVGNIGIKDYKPYFWSQNSSYADSGELALKDYVDALETELNELKTIVYDNVVPQVADLDYTYLSYADLPNGVNNYPIIFSAGMDMVNVKGNSFVYNQLIENGNFADTTGWTNFACGFSVSNNVASILATASNGGISKAVDLIANHKYLFQAKVILTTQTTNVRINIYNPDVSGYDAMSEYTKSGSLSQTLNFIKVAGYTYTYYFRVLDSRSNDWDTVQIKEVMTFDLTANGLDSVTTVEQAKAELLKRGVNIDEYNPYSAGEIRNSKPVKIVVRGFNQWDEEWEVGAYNNNTGEKAYAINCIRCKNLIRVKENTTYYLKVGSITGSSQYIQGCFYDASGNFLTSSYTGGYFNSTFVVPNGAYYMAFSMPNTYGTTYNHDICINRSIPSLNGTYLPFQKDERPIIPIDMGEVDLGSLNWVKDSSGYYQAEFSANAKHYTASETANIKADNYKTVALVSIQSNTGFRVGIYYDSVNYIRMADENSATLSDFITAVAGVKLKYELATQTHHALNGINNVHDDKDKVRIKEDTISVTDIYQRSGNDNVDFAVFTTAEKWISAKENEILFANGVEYYTSFDSCSQTGRYLVFDTNSHRLAISVPKGTTGEQAIALLNGVKFIYALNTPTDQSPAINLPENLNIQKGGTIEIEYADGHTVCSDFDFEVATSKIVED